MDFHSILCELLEFHCDFDVFLSTVRAKACDGILAKKPKAK